MLPAPSCALFHERTGDEEKAQWCRRSAYQEAKALNKWETNDDKTRVVQTAIAAMVDGAITDGSKKALGASKLALRSVMKQLEQAAEKGDTSPVRATIREELAVLFEKLSDAHEASKNAVSP